MSDRGNNTGDGLTFLAVVLLIIAFAGEPELCDAIIYHLYGGDVPVTEEPAQ